MSHLSTDDLRRMLAELSEYETVSRFSLQYCQLIVDRLSRPDHDNTQLRHAFAAHLARELRHHRRARNLLLRPGVEVGDAFSLAEKRAIALRDTADLLAQSNTHNDAQAATLCLALAECHYHLGLYDHVVADLEVALSLGVQDPLVHFALGYNRCKLAQQAFVAVEASTGELVVTDPHNYRLAMLEAVSAFEGGLNGGEMDAQLYRWMGACLQQAGFTEAAGDALAHADAVGRDESAEPTSDRQPPTELPQISDEELAAVAEFLKRPHRREELLGGLDEAPDA